MRFLDLLIVNGEIIIIIIIILQVPVVTLGCRIQCLTTNKHGRLGLITVRDQSIANDLIRND